MAKYFLVDVGELGWSLYISAYAAWLMTQKHEVVIMTSKDRLCLHSFTKLIPLPNDFEERFGHAPQDGFGRHGIGHVKLSNYFANHIPKGFEYPPHFLFRCSRIPKEQMIFSSYTSYPLKYQDKRIMIFPRCRASEHHSFRNLRKEFYIGLINRLDKEFEYPIATMGTTNGAYKITQEEVKSNKFIDMVGLGRSLQDMLNHLRYSVCAIGGTSAPPKIAMLQGVPTYVIGHEKQRFTVEENYLNTKIGFFEVGGRNDYKNFNEEHCINQIVQFVGDLK